MNLIIILILLFIEKQFPQRKCKYLLGRSCVLLPCSQPGALNFPWHNVWRPSKVGTASVLHCSTQTDEFASLISEQWCRGSLGELHSSFVHFAIQSCPRGWPRCVGQWLFLWESLKAAGFENTMIVPTPDQPWVFSGDKYMRISISGAFWNWFLKLIRDWSSYVWTSYSWYHLIWACSPPG